MSNCRFHGASRRGITIAEVLITMVIIGIVLTASVSLFGQSVRHFSKTSTDLSAEQQARITMARVTDQLRQAMPNPNVPPQPPILEPAPSATATASVQFTVAEQFSSADFTALPYDTVTIFLSTPPPGHDSGDLIMTVTPPNGQTTSTIIGSDVLDFGVQAIYQDMIDIKLTVSPVIRTDMAIKPYTLNTRVFVSYYKTNS